MRSAPRGRPALLCVLVALRPALGFWEAFAPARAVLVPRGSAARPAVAALTAVAEEDFDGVLRRFAPQAELAEVRSQRRQLQDELGGAVGREDYATAITLRDDLAEVNRKDPAATATTLREELAAAVAGERYGEAARCRDRLLVLRRYLPQYQLAGLWKGNYPNHGDELVRLHYDGEQLYATKMTGDEHVPAGEITFRADLSKPFEPAERKASPFKTDADDDDGGVRVEVVSLDSEGDQQQREVEQFRGEGRIAARGFQHAHYVPGQLFLMDDDVLGFLWLPIGTFVVFARVAEETEDVLEAEDGAEDVNAGGDGAQVGAAVGNEAGPDEGYSMGAGWQ